MAGRFEPESDSYHRMLRSIAEKLGLMNSTTFARAPAEEIGDLMNACDLGLFPFRDGVSLRRTSALVEGLPTITTEPYEEIPGLIESGNVRLVPRKNIAKLATIILEIASNPRYFPICARESPLKRMFSWPDIAQRTSDFYYLAARRKSDRMGIGNSLDCGFSVDPNRNYGILPQVEEIREFRIYKKHIEMNLGGGVWDLLRLQWIDAYWPHGA